MLKLIEEAREDPSLFWGVVVTIVSTALTAGIAFLAPLSDPAQGAVTSALTAIATSLVAWLIRREAWKPSTVARRIADVAQGRQDGQ